METIIIKPLIPELNGDYLDFSIIVRLRMGTQMVRVIVHHLIKMKKILNRWLASLKYLV